MAGHDQAADEFLIAIDAVSKAFRSNGDVGPNNTVFDKLSLKLKRGELCTLFGPNGCGKTTMLNLIAGLIQQDSGTVTIASKRPSAGIASYMFQNFKDSLLTWRSVKGNLLFPLECRFDTRREQKQKLQEFLSDFDLPVPLDARVYELSVGQQQMVAFARTLVTRPTVLLLDEPFSALDFRVRRAMQEQLLKYWETTRSTIVIVSHEIDEAIFLGQRLILFPQRPISATAELMISLPFPRQRDLLFTDACFELRSKALRFFEK